MAVSGAPPENRGHDAVMSTCYSDALSLVYGYKTVGMGRFYDQNEFLMECINNSIAVVYPVPQL